MIQTGDLIVAEDEGVLIVPQNIEHDVIAAAEEKVETESAVAKTIKDGLPSQGAFQKFGVM